jgi:ClpP class serine protease
LASGLVDELGGLWDAIELAAERGRIDEPYRVVFVREPRRRFPAELFGPLRARLVPWLLGGGG